MILKTKTGEIYVSFNQSKNYCCFGTDIGFYIYQISPFKKIISRKIDGGIKLIKMLHESNIFIFTGKNKGGLYPNNKLIVWDDEKKSVLGEVNFNAEIKDINITRNNIIVLCNSKIYVYTFDKLELVKTIDIDTENEIFSIGNEDCEYLVYTGEERGSINITKLNSDYLETIEAHDSSIEKVLLSRDGRYIVTASERGTLIRLFNLETKEQLKEFRRGCDPVKIVDLCLSDDNSILLVGSEKGTIHLFNTCLNDDYDQKNKHWNKYGMKYIKGVLPEYFSSEWSFAQVYLSNTDTHTWIDSVEKKLYTFGNNGQFYLIDYEDPKVPIIQETIKYISDESDPFSKRSTTIR